MFDGQHRRRAIKDALKELGNSKKAMSLKKASLPVMIYVEDRIEALQLIVRRRGEDQAH